MGAEEVGDGEDLRTAAALTAETYLAAHQIAVATAPVSQEALIARRALVHRLIDKSLRLTQVVGEPGQRRLVRLTATESESALAATWSAIVPRPWSVVGRMERSGPRAGALGVGPVAHRARPHLELWSVTAVVTYDDRPHAPTACASVGVSSRSS